MNSRARSANATAGFCALKNRALQATFSTRFIANRLNNIFLCFSPELISEKYIESAIIANNIVQAIGNTMFGGVIGGFTASYHASIFVKRLPMAAATTTARME